MYQEDLNQLQKEVFEHLFNGRFRLALSRAEKIYSFRPDDSEAVISYAWALLENGNPVKALEFANIAVELKGDSDKARFYRGYILYRMSIYEGAIADFQQSIVKQRESLAWSFYIQAHAFAGQLKLDEAQKSLDLALIMNDQKNKDWHNLKKWLEKAHQYFIEQKELSSSEIDILFNEAKDSLKEKEYWFALLSARNILKNVKDDEAELLELEAMVNLFQIKPAQKKIKEMQNKFKKNEKFNHLVNYVNNLLKLEEKERTKVTTRNTFATKSFDDFNPLNSEFLYRSDSIFYPNNYANIYSIKLYELNSPNSTDRVYLKQLPISYKKFGIEIIFNNPFFKETDKLYAMTFVLYHNDFEIFKLPFQMNTQKEWDSVIFTQTIDTLKTKKWDEGQAKLELYINNFKVGERYFGVSQNVLFEYEDNQSEPSAQTPKKEEKINNFSHLKKSGEKNKSDEKEVIPNQRNVKPLGELIEELNRFTGLSGIKEAIKTFISYLEFIQERKRLGLKSEENISINAIFLGNPGTGKTTIARLLGDIFFAMGILPSGHVIEVDRSGFVGQYIGETAQKAEKVIGDAIGGVLFIDEAYTLVKKGGSQDFGQEAIDVLLKRMEDRKGEFVVIVAGYTDEMNSFLNSNPGLRSRFSHTFVFDDYSPDELMQIFKDLLTKEDYKITQDAEELLKKEFYSLYRSRDKSFGNARLVRKIFNDCKINLSKIISTTGESLITKENIATITLQVIEKTLQKNSKKDVQIPINEEALSEALIELDGLVGLTSLKKEVYDLIKLARFLKEEKQDLKKVFSEHILFLGNPGTGKTTVARIFGKIYSALGILPKGHLIEADRQSLVAGYVGQTAEKTTSIIEKSIGGMLFIDEAYTLVKSGDSGNDFGKEAIDILLKRMEDDRGKFNVIAAGYTDEMKAFVASNPGMQSRFSKSFHFDDYSPSELMEIVNRTLSKEKKKLHISAEERLLQHFEKMYNNRDKKFGNARLVRNIIESVKQKMLLRIAEIPQDKRNDEITSIILENDINEVLNRDEEAKSFTIKGDPLKLQNHIDELNQYVGQSEVKNEIFRLINYARFVQLKKEQGIKSIDRNFNLLCIGNQATGKKSIIRICGQIFKEIGILSKGHVVEVDRTDLVASYPGQTTTNTEKIIQQANGGILYLKEAHNLVLSKDDLGQEAIQVILNTASDFSKKMIFVLSDTAPNLKNIILKFPKIEKMFPHKFIFKDYTAYELLAIAYNMAYKNGYTLDEGAQQEMLDLFVKIIELNKSQNAYTAKNLLFSSISSQEERILNIFEMEDVDLTTITLDDVQKNIL
jgi:SpoVK/Ycf46/Vps4 family AAA+-type ATPase